MKSNMAAGCRFAEFMTRAHAQRQTRPEVQLDDGGDIKIIAPNRVRYFFCLLTVDGNWFAFHAFVVLLTPGELWRRFWRLNVEQTTAAEQRDASRAEQRVVVETEPE